MRIGKRRSLQIADPVLGSITVDESHRSLIELPLLQRLRRIRQTPAASFVFPSADHSRFVHSLGAYHWAQHYAEALELKDTAGAVCCAALLHDIGHYPLSHTMEPIYQRMPSDMLPTDPFASDDAEAVRERLWEHAERDPLGFACWAPTPIDDTYADHEDLTVHALEGDSTFRRAVCAMDGNCDPDMVLDLLRGSSAHDKGRLRQMFHSQLDVDRMDYLVRDSHVTGAIYGLVEPAHIIKDAGFGEREDDPEQQVIAFRERAIPRLEHFLLARHFHYANLIFHKTVVGFDVLLRAVCAGLIRSAASELPSSYEEVRDWCAKGKFTTLTDNLVYVEIAKRASSHNDILADLCQMVLNRIRPRTLLEVRRADPSDVERLLALIEDRESLRAMTIKHNLDLGRLGFRTWTLGFGRAKHAEEDIWIQQSGRNPAVPIFDCRNSILHCLRDTEIVGVNVYYFDDDADTESLSSFAALLQEAVSD